MATINYIAVVKQLESGKFLVSFPDFEGITTTAETEESIQDVAAGVIKTKLAELKKTNIEAPEPKKIAEISKELKDGEFTTYVAVKESFDFKNNVPEGKENLFGMGGGVLSILNTLFLGVITIKVPFFGNYSIGFFKGISELADFSKEAKNARFILMFSGILFLALAGLLIYSSFSKNKNLLKYSIFGNIAFLIIFYIVLYVKLPSGEASKYISVSYFKILIYIISLGLVYLTYRALNKKEEAENIEETVKPLGTILEKEEDKGE